MLTRWTDLNRSLSALELMRRRLDQVFDEYGHGIAAGAIWHDAWPPMAVEDRGEHVFVLAQLPGVAEHEIELTVNRDMLSIHGERRIAPPEGYRVHRRERPSVSYGRSINLPAAIDPERVQASACNGVLTIKMEKADEARPRRILVRANEEGGRS